MSDGDVSPVNGRRPVVISYMTMPSEKMSLRPSTARASICSGDMYGIVPRIEPACVSPHVRSKSAFPRGAASRARPKSRTFTRPASVTITFAGLRSRCVICF